MKELIRLLEDYETFHFELTYSKMTYWRLRIYKLGCGKNGSDIIIFEEQDIDCHYLIAKAEVKLKDYLNKIHGGY